jgi:hypothetical protein
VPAVRSRLARLALAVSVAAAVVVVVAPPAPAGHRAGPCALHREDGESLRQLSRRRIRCAIREFGPVPGGAARAICIADRESGLIPTARSRTGMYLGLFQHAAASWDDRYERWTYPGWELPVSALRGRTNAIVAIRMVEDAGRWGRAGWPVKDC